MLVLTPCSPSTPYNKLRGLFLGLESEANITATIMQCFSSLL